MSAYSEEDFGPWIIWGKPERPHDLNSDDNIKVICFLVDMTVLSESTQRTVKEHQWNPQRKDGKDVTLAYRVRKHVTPPEHLAHKTFTTPQEHIEQWVSDTCMQYAAMGLYHTRVNKSINCVTGDSTVLIEFWEVEPEHKGPVPWGDIQ